MSDLPPGRRTCLYSPAQMDALIAPPDIIECNVPPYEDRFRIDLLQPE